MGVGLDVPQLGASEKKNSSHCGPRCKCLGCRNLPQASLTPNNDIDGTDSESDSDYDDLEEGRYKTLWIKFLVKIVRMTIILTVKIKLEVRTEKKTHGIGHSLSLADCLLTILSMCCVVIIYVLNIDKKLAKIRGRASMM